MMIYSCCNQRQTSKKHEKHKQKHTKAIPWQEKETPKHETRKALKKSKNLY